MGIPAHQNKLKGGNMSKSVSKNLETRLIGENNTNIYEKELENKIEQEILEARKEREREANKSKRQIVITDINQITPDKRFDKHSIYMVFNRKQKTETFINGEQAENMLKYTDDYVIKFDHRIEYK
jgi:hypothetical protein